MKKIIWNYNRSALQNEGYRTSAEEISSRVHKKGLNTEIYIDELPMGIVNLINQSGDNQRFINCDSNDVFINNTLPSSYKISNGYNIGFSYWETTRIPKDWVDKMNKMDEIWTTSKFIKNVFIESGVTVPVYAFTLGIDDELYRPALRQPRVSYPFTFLSIGSPSTRKNSQMTVDAFVKLFGNDDRYKLIYKSMGSPDARLDRDTTNIRSIYNHPNIEVIEDDLSNEDLALLYERVDCVVYPTSGEGWGWFPFQSIAKGIPTICPSGTACSEYAHLSIELDFEWSSDNMFGLYIGNGEWMKPNFQDLCDKMLDVSCNYEKYAEETYRNVVEVYKHMTWDSSIEGYYKRLCQILNQ